jgi:hypothetical protein
MPPPTWEYWPDWDRRTTDRDEAYYVKKGVDPDIWFTHPIPFYTSTRPFSPLDSATGRLHLSAEVAYFTITGEHADIWSQSPECAQGTHTVCQLAMFAADSSRAGTVTVDGDTYERLDFGQRSRFAFVKLSQTTLAVGRDDTAWNAETQRYAGLPGTPAINPQEPFGPEYDDVFDSEKYELNVCWCLYNVLMVEWRDSIAYRVGVGQVHIHAFDGAEPQRMDLMLG